MIPSSSDTSDSFVVCSSWGDLYQFEDSRMAALCMVGKSSRRWNVYKRLHGVWRLVPVSDEMSIGQLRETISKA